MRITFTRTGGFSGVRLRVVVDEKQLPPHGAARLRELVVAADCFQLPHRLTVPRQQPDRFQYELIFEEGDRKHAVVIDDEAASAAVLALVEWLTDAARRG